MISIKEDMCFRTTTRNNRFAAASLIDLNEANDSTERADTARNRE